MSRVAKKPIALPKGVEFKNENGQLNVKGGKTRLLDQARRMLEDSAVNFARSLPNGDFLPLASR